MKLTGEDIAALVLVQILAFGIISGIVYVALRFHGLDWKARFRSLTNIQ